MRRGEDSTREMMCRVRSRFSMIVSAILCKASLMLVTKRYACRKGATVVMVTTLTEIIACSWCAHTATAVLFGKYFGVCGQTV